MVKNLEPPFALECIPSYKEYGVGSLIIIIATRTRILTNTQSHIIICVHISGV